MNKSSPFAYLAEEAEKPVEYTMDCKGDSYTLAEIIQALQQIAETIPSDTPLFSEEFGSIIPIRSIAIEKDMIVFTK